VTADASPASLGLLLAGVPRSAGAGPELVANSVALAHGARDAGFSHLVVGQHFLGAPNQYLHAIPLLTRLVPETGDMRLATGILLMSLAQPVDLAEQLATLDVISGGRLTVGIGAGYRQEEFAAFGTLKKERVPRMVEALDVVRKIWTGAPLAHEGRFFTVHADGGSLRPLQQPGPPIWSAAMAPVSVERAIRLGAKPYAGPRVPITEVADWVTQYREATGDPTATIPVRRDLYIGTDSRTAWAEAVAHIEERFDVYKDWGLGKDLAKPASDPSDDLRASVIAGDRREIEEGLRRYVEIGAGPIILRCQWSALDLAGVLGQIEGAAEALR
jgi:alkanesulfonate monooxygenase SsuD/methylene tetrahydromethanopterin reductase-like flavin-dependent oxidoreductase (luciferase family)